MIHSVIVLVMGYTSLSVKNPSDTSPTSLLSQPTKPKLSMNAVVMSFLFMSIIHLSIFLHMIAASKENDIGCYVDVLASISAV